MPLEAALEQTDKPELRPWPRLLRCTNLAEGDIGRRPAPGEMTT